MQEGTSIFSADAHGINRAMEIILQQNHHFDELYVFTDSRSALQASESPKNEKHLIIKEIVNTAEFLKSSGTQVTLFWIPSHLGIPENEKADHLASTESSSLTPTRIQNNTLSTAERSTIFKDYLKKSTWKHYSGAMTK